MHAGGWVLYQVATDHGPLGWDEVMSQARSVCAAMPPHGLPVHDREHEHVPLAAVSAGRTTRERLRSVDEQLRALVEELSATGSQASELSALIFNIISHRYTDLHTRLGLRPRCSCGLHAHHMTCGGRAGQGTGRQP